MLNSGHFTDSPESVRKQLNRILSSHEFKNSQVVCRFLEFVVEEVLAGRANEIKEYTIGVKALGRSADFNPQFDAVVRIHAGRLRRMLREYYNGNTSSEPLLIEIPKGSYVPAFRSLTTDITHAQDTMKSTNGVGKEGDDILYRKATVAVFPFHNLSADDSKKFFAEGIGEQLSVELAWFQHLSVISYYATDRLSAEKNGREMHNLLDIDYIITGSTRFFDGLVQINAQVIVAETEAMLWSQTFVREFNVDNILNIQRDVVQQILYKIADQDGVITNDLANTASPKKKNAFGLYEGVYLYFSFRGRYDHESFDKAKAAIEKAAEVDPNNALIMSLRSRLCVNRYIFEADPEDLEKGKAYAEKALWLDSDCQYAYKALAWSHLLTGKTTDCKEAIDRCLELNPNAPTMLGSMGFLNVCIGRYGEGFNLLSKVSTLSQILPWYCNVGLALYYYYIGRYQEAHDWAQKAEPLDMPLIALVNNATRQRIKTRKNDLHHKTSPISRDVTDRSVAFIPLFIHDPELRHRLLKELQLTGAGIE
jgi:TolB-like protein